MVQAVGGWVVGFLGLLYRIVVEVGCISYVVVDDGGCSNLVVEVLVECGSLAELVEVCWH
jgi:hypothetical protein